MTIYFARSKDGRCAIVESDTPDGAIFSFEIAHDITLTSKRALSDIDDALYNFFGYIPKRRESLKPDGYFTGTSVNHFLCTVREYAQAA